MLRLEKLEIAGFKSFSEKTSLIFGEGITGVVGPNGCGKSNIAEAISWVLGEQSAKNLRGGKMEDVIFNGTRDRKAMGMAEVMLTLVALEDICGTEDTEVPDPLDDDKFYDTALETAETSIAHAGSLAKEVAERESAITKLEQGLESNAPQAENPDAASLVGQSPQRALLSTDINQTTVPAEVEGKREKTTVARLPRKRKKRTIAISAGERIVIGRRLYRTGDSEYIMNGRSCLLRDIQDFFSGTGLGGSHYAIIEQGRVGQILSSKPLDRRALIEEAAGITKFKSRKRTTELKLESAKGNLSRLNDIISEVERQVNSLKRQAAKARRYRRLRDEMRSLLKFVFTADYYRLNKANSKVTIELEQASSEQAEMDTLLVSREAEHRVVAAQTREMEDALTTLRERSSSVQLEADRARNRRAFEEQQIRELTGRIQELERDQHTLTERLTLLETESDGRTSDLKKLETELISKQAGLNTRETSYQEEMSGLRKLEADIEQLRQKMLSEIGSTERLRNYTSNLQDAMRRLELKQANLSSELDRANNRRDEVEKEHDRINGAMMSGRAQIECLTKKIEEHNATQAGIREKTQALRLNQKDIQTERAAAEQRQASLEDLDKHHAYYSDAVQKVLDPGTAARINALGTLADYIEVDPQYEKLVESLFGRELQSILVPTIDDALAGVDLLTAEDLGRGAFLVVGLHGAEDDSPLSASAISTVGNSIKTFSQSKTTSIIRSESSAQMVDPDSSVSEVDAQAGRFQLEPLRAIDLLVLRSEIKAVVQRAFPEKCAASVVPDIEAALQLSIENNWRIYITNQGEQVVNGRLIITSGQAGQRGTSLLGLKREIKQLRAQAETLRSREEEVTTELSVQQQNLDAVEKEILLLDSELRSEERSCAARGSELESYARDLERSLQHVRVVEDEIQRTGLERVELEAETGRLRSELEAAEASRETVQQALAEAQAGFAAMRVATEKLSEELSAARASVAAQSERLRAAQAELRRIENEAQELRSRINRNRVEHYDSQGRIEQIQTAHSQGEDAVERFIVEGASLAEQIETASQLVSESRVRTDELETELRNLRHQVSSAHDRRGEIEVERARIQSEAEHLTRSCFAELAMPLEEVLASVELSRAADTAQKNEQAPSSIESDEDLAEQTQSSGPDRFMTGEEDIEASRTRLNELRVKLDEIGPVNMMALEELEESEERFTFLSTQRQDILDSIKATEEALTEIKRRSRERFRRAFIEINENFQRMFVELFGGGRGEMILIDEEDVLESGIDLIAQPPGKRLQNVLLLSGGEKAMAAISLILAIFQYRPSPFCILDEVDAPLDEMNIGRFAGKITEMSNDTQFLVITHNKRTMEATQALYGVTMEEPGVSKLVSVRFE